MRTPDLRNERGIALVVAVFALVVIGALVAGTVFLGRLELQSSQSALFAAEAQEAAEAGLANRIEAWDVLIYNEMGYGEANAINGGTVALGANADFTDQVYRFNNNMFVIRSTGRRLGAGGVPLAERTVAGFMRLARPTVAVNAAITVTELIQFNGNAFNVTGYNTNPPGWDDCAPEDPSNLDDKVGVRSATQTGVGKTDLDNVYGSPVPYVANDPNITSETFQNFLDYTYNQLTSQTQVKVLPLDTPYLFAPVIDASTDPDSCDRSVLLNMGEPMRDFGSVAECYNYFPVVHGTADRTVMAANSKGQGTLLIDGNLELYGGFEWSGLIIVRGSIIIAGTGNKLFGAVLAESVTDNNAISGDVQIKYSDCAIQKAVKGSALPMPLRTRSWVSVVQ
jgi:hypothetical protein